MCKWMFACPFYTSSLIWVDFGVGQQISTLRGLVKIGPVKAAFHVVPCMNFCPYFSHCGPGSSVGIVTDYALNGPRIESRWGRDFPHLSTPVQGPTQPPVEWVPGLSWG
jgi:hypothetical protein